MAFLKDGRYTVQSYNGKDAILVDEQGHFETLTKSEFPESFEAIAYPGETIIAETRQRVWPSAGTKDERQREAFQRTQANIKKRQEIK